ncbi:N-acetylmuramic acid 6-phosphate etherase [bacterium]|nr:N-acetylmuramic acid 6-phosphate etherase [bacterium]
MSTNETSKKLETSGALTEKRNPRTVAIDRLPTREVVRVFSREDRSVFDAVEAVGDDIAHAIEIIVAGLRRGGRLLYIGAGTSGRLGVLDASECPPTFGVKQGVVVALIAGGAQAITQAVEGAEDDGNQAINDLKSAELTPPDVLVGISASGLTVYVREALAYSSRMGCRTVLLTCNPYGNFPKVDVLINPVVGPEVITGSTRLKCGTACKMVLNMLSSISMIRLGKVYQNLMVDLMPTNEKLKKRALQIVMDGGGIPNYEAEVHLLEADGEVKTAIYLAKKGGSPKEAREAILKSQGILYKALKEEDDDDQ